MPFKSKSQQRLFFAKEKRGELPEGTAKKWAEHTPDIKALPEKVKKKKKKKFTDGFKKTAGHSLIGSTDEALRRHNKQIMEKMRSKKSLLSMKNVGTPGLKLIKKADPSLSMEANEQSGQSMGNTVPATELRNNAETGQFQGRSYRTQGVQNENKEMKAGLKQKSQTARGGKHYGSTIR